MTRKSDAWLPLYVGDYMADTSHLTTEQHGAYLLILMALWKRSGAGLPDVDENLAAAARLPLARWKAVRPMLIDGVLLRTDGQRVEQKRMQAEIERAQGITEARAAAGAKGGATAQANRKQIGQANYKQTEEANAKQTSTPSPSPSPSEIQMPDEANASSSSAEPTAKPRRQPKGPDNPAPTIPCPYDEIVGLYHDALCPPLPRCRLMPADRQRALRKAWAWVLSSRTAEGQRRAETAEQALDWFRRYFALAAENDWLMGRTPRSADHANWKPDLDFLLTDRGMKAVIEKTQVAA